MSDSNISRREFFKRLGGVALAVSPVATSLTSLTSCSVGASRKKGLTILHTNDVHSHIDPFPETDNLYAGKGGYARRQAFIESVIKEQGAENVLVFECGDMFQGTPYFNFFKGQLEMQLMNRMHVDAVTIGNHEFDNGVSGLCDCMETANFPFLCANYLFSDDRGSKLVKPYQVFERGGIRVGVFGLGIRLEGLVAPKNSKGVQFKEIVPTAQEMADTLRNVEGCQLVIALTHIGYDMQGGVDDIRLAKQTSGIDIILGGHSHTFLPQPDIVTNKDGRSVVVNQVGYGGINVGKLTVGKEGATGGIAYLGGDNVTMA
ncbi:MAG: metallophosphoesterase [Bacteroidales bacterium]|nr:metallophosphoesterase [Bacteroidales bacterium]